MLSLVTVHSLLFGVLIGLNNSHSPDAGKFEPFNWWKFVSKRSVDSYWVLRGGNDVIVAELVSGAEVAEKIKFASPRGG